MKSWSLILVLALLVAVAAADVRVTKFHNPLCIGRGEPITFAQEASSNDTCVPYFDGTIEATDDNGTLPLGYLNASQCDASLNFTFTLSKDENCTTLGDEFFVGLPGECNLVHLAPEEPEEEPDDKRRHIRRRLMSSAVKRAVVGHDCKRGHGDHCGDGGDDDDEKLDDSMTVSCDGALPEFHDWIEIELCEGEVLPEPVTLPAPTGTEEPTVLPAPISTPPLALEPLPTEPLPTVPLTTPISSTIPTTIAPVGETVEPTLLEPTTVVEPLEAPTTTTPPCGCTGKMTQIKTWLDVEGCQRVYVSGDLPTTVPHYEDKRAHGGKRTTLPTGEYVLVPTNRSCPADGEPYTISFYTDANCSLLTKELNATAQGCTTNDAQNLLMYCSGRNATIPQPGLEPSILPPDTPTEPGFENPTLFPPTNDTPTSNIPLQPTSDAPEASLAHSIFVLAVTLPLLVSLF